MIGKLAPGIAALALAVAFGATPVSAGSAPFSVKAAKHKDGPYRVDLRANPDVGDTVNLYWRLASKSSDPQELTFIDEEAEFQSGYRVRWFHSGENVTDEVAGAGREVRLRPGEREFLRVEVRRRPAGEAMCIYGEATEGAESSAATASLNTLCAF
jgi:hypothetical protein